MILRISRGSLSRNGDVFAAEGVEASSMTPSEVLSSSRDVVDVGATKTGAVEARWISLSEVSLIRGEGDGELVAVGCDHAEPIVAATFGTWSASQVSC